MATAAAFDYRGEYDENWPLPKRLTLEQYRRVIFRPDAHFVDGRIVPRTLGDRTHGEAVVAVAGCICAASETVADGCCISLRLQTSPTRIRVCDIVVLAAGAPNEPVPTIAPLLCIEVITTGQVPEDEVSTLADYVRMGVQNVWLIDPIRHKTFTFDGSGLHESDGTRLTIPDSPIRLDLTEAFAAFD